MACYRLASESLLCDLDDPSRLRALGLRPSDVVSRDYARTRLWVRRIYQQGKWAGVSWWSYYDPRWISVGVWATSRLMVREVRRLQLTDPAIIEASRTIARRIAAAL